MSVRRWRVSTAESESSHRRALQRLPLASAGTSSRAAASTSGRHRWRPGLRDARSPCGRGNSGQAALFMSRRSDEVNGTSAGGEEVDTDPCRAYLSTRSNGPPITVQPGRRHRAAREDQLEGVQMMTPSRKADVQHWQFPGCSCYTAHGRHGWMAGSRLKDKRGVPLLTATAYRKRSSDEPAGLRCHGNQPAGGLRVGARPRGQSSGPATALGEGSMAVRLVFERLLGQWGDLPIRPRDETGREPTPRRRFTRRFPAGSSTIASLEEGAAILMTSERSDSRRARCVLADGRQMPMSPSELAGAPRGPVAVNAVRWALEPGR